MNQNNIDVQETAAPTIEELNETIAGLQKQVLSQDQAIHTLKEALVKLAVKL